MKQRLLSTWLLTMFLALFAVNAWGEKITKISQIVSGEQYYIGATVSGTDYYLSIADHGASVATGKKGTGVTTKAEADKFTFASSSAGWSIQFESGNYLTLASSKSNGNVNVADAVANWAITETGGLLNLKINGYCLMKNNSASPNFGSYASGQTNVWLESVGGEVTPQKTVSSITIKTAPTKTDYVQGEKFNPTGIVITANYSDATTADIAYADHTSEFSFSPTLDTALATTDKNVTITYGEKSATQAITVSSDAPVYASLADLVAAGAPTTTGRKVTVTLTDEEIQRIYVTSKGYRNGIILQVGEREVEIFSYDVPETWVEGGTVSGTLTNCDWKLYNSTWELCPADWTELTYTAPSSSAVLESIAITGTPTTTDYRYGASFSTEGLTVTAYYDDESTRDVTADVEWTIDPEVFNVSGDEIAVKATANYGEKEVSETYMVSVAERPDYVFYESFDKNDGTGGNDGKWSGSIASNDIKYDNEGWDAQNATGADQCAKFGAGSKLGFATTPTINYTGDLVLTFKAAAWESAKEKTNLFLEAEGATIYSKSVEMQKGAWTSYTVYIKADGDFKLTFKAGGASSNRFFLDEVMLKAAPAEAITISDKALDDASGNYYATYYTGLTFAVPAGLHCATVSVNADDLLVVNEFAAEAIIPANTGLLVWAAEAGTYDIALASSPHNTTITDNCLYGSLEAAETAAPTADAYEFFKLTKPEGKNLGFWWGAADGAAFLNGAHKAYLAVPAAVAAKVKGFALSDITTAVRTATAKAADAAIYDLQGRRVSNAQRGTLYIQGGKKYIK